MFLLKLDYGNDHLYYDLYNDYDDDRGELFLYGVLSICRMFTLSRLSSYPAIIRPAYSIGLITLVGVKGSLALLLKDYARVRVYYHVSCLITVFGCPLLDYYHNDNYDFKEYHYDHGDDYFLNYYSLFYYDFLNDYYFLHHDLHYELLDCLYYHFHDFKDFYRLELVGQLVRTSIDATQRRTRQTNRNGRWDWRSFRLVLLFKQGAVPAHFCVLWAVLPCNLAVFGLWGTALCYGVRGGIHPVKAGFVTWFG